MEETGCVIEVKGDIAVVRMSAGAGCESCSAAGACKAAAAGARMLEAENRIGAKAGQHVLVELSSGSFLKASFLVYMLPVVFLFIGAALGGMYGPMLSGAIRADYWQAIGGIALMAVAVVAVRFYNNTVKREGALRPVITKVIEDVPFGNTA